MTITATETRYQTIHRMLLDRFALDRPRITLDQPTGPSVEIRTFDFTSRHGNLHPPARRESTDPTLGALISYYLEQSPYSSRNFSARLRSADRDVEENLRFRYPVFVPAQRSGTPRRFARGTVLFHGLNERSWHKYLPWAQRLVERTDRPVILFPIAFHMTRAPETWADPREMTGVVRERRRLFPGLGASSFANAALSHRIQFAPYRFLTSGLQSYHDAVDLATSIRDADHGLFRRDAQLDFFGYSIGASLTELLMMHDPDGLFAGSRGFLFCGGSVLDRSSPVSKMIIDEEAYRGLARFFDRLVNAPESAIPDWILDRGPGERRVIELIRSLLFTDRLRTIREEAMAKIGKRIAALAMERDPVFDAEGVEASWRDRTGSALIRVDRVDPDYDYSHEQPFPLRSQAPHVVDAFFTEVFDRAAEHLRALPTTGLC